MLPAMLVSYLQRRKYTLKISVNKCIKFKYRIYVTDPTL
jgi:hypothetical protein